MILKVWYRLVAFGPRISPCGFTFQPCFNFLTLFVCSGICLRMRPSSRYPASLHTHSPTFETRSCYTPNCTPSLWCVAGCPGQLAAPRQRCRRLLHLCRDCNVLFGGIPSHLGWVHRARACGQNPRLISSRGAHKTESLLASVHAGARGAGVCGEGAGSRAAGELRRALAHSRTPIPPRSLVLSCEAVGSGGRL